MAKSPGNTSPLSASPTYAAPQTANPGMSAAAMQTMANTQMLATQQYVGPRTVLPNTNVAAPMTAYQKTYTVFNTDPIAGDVRPNQQETVTKGLFAGNTGSLTGMFTSSNLTTIQKTYYQEIYSSADPAASNTANVEFSIAYGHLQGSGSKDDTGNLNNDTPSRAIYKQYASILLEPKDKKFTFNGVDCESIYILNFNRARLRERLDEGNFELTMAYLSGSNPAGPSQYNGDLDSHTGSAVMPDIYGGPHNNDYIQIIDDSTLEDATVGSAGKIYNLVSGSIDGGTSIHNSSAPVYYGLLYPQYGVAVLNADALDAKLDFGTVTGSQVQGDNPVKMFTSLSASNDITPNDVNGGIQARSSEQVKSTYYFVRVKNGEYNYSNNPSFITGSAGELAFKSFVNDPQTYITSIGLYNSDRELLAVAKLSQPLLKSFTREALVRVKLDF